MIRVSIFNKKDGIGSFSCVGHAEYAEEGSDIVCAAVSALVLNTVNSIEAFSDARFWVEEKDGRIHFTLENTECPKAQLLMQSLQLGLQNIENEYGSQYVKVTIVS